jgi:hypothetical protein
MELVRRPRRGSGIRRGGRGVELVREKAAGCGGGRGCGRRGRSGSAGSEMRGRRRRCRRWLCSGSTDLSYADKKIIHLVIEKYFVRALLR